MEYGAWQLLEDVLAAVGIGALYLLGSVAVGSVVGRLLERAAREQTGRPGDA